MIPLSSIKPFPCLTPGSTVVAVEPGDSNPDAPVGDVTIANVVGLQAALDGKATAAQGAKADSAVQPGSSPALAGLTVNGGGNALYVTGNINATSYSNYPYFSLGYPSGKITIGSSTVLGWAPGDYLNPIDVALMRNGDGVLEVNNGTTSAYRDITLRDLIAARYIRPASYTVAAANALVGVPDGARIQVSNDANGSIPAFYRTGTGWLRYDNTAIST